MKRSLGSCLLAFTLLPLALQGCGESDTHEPISEAKSTALRVTSPQVSEADTTTFATDNRAFALDAYKALTASHDNLVFSPTSISLALAMTYAGAVGTTAGEMATALHFTLPPERLHPAFDALDLALAARGEGALGADGGPMRLHVVNAAWAEKTYTFKADYLDTLAMSYGAGIYLLDFMHAPDASRITINDWVADATEQKIKDLLAPEAIDPATRLVLTNAVYFNAAWKNPFDPENTHDGTFTRVDGSTVTTPFMGAHLDGALGVQGDGFAAVALPYQDDRLDMLLIVPDSGTLASFEASLDAAKLDAIMASMVSQPVVLGMPRFKIETGQSLATLLQGLGMNAAFVFGQADFSGMDGTHDLYIGDVIHKAFIAVGEKGTEAAAATAVVMKAGSAPPSGLMLFADRPFLYILRDQPTGAILFMGRVLDPTQG
jgi:serpin B